MNTLTPLVPSGALVSIGETSTWRRSWSRRNWRPHTRRLRARLQAVLSLVRSSQCVAEREYWFVKPEMASSTWGRWSGSVGLSEARDAEDGHSAGVFRLWRSDQSSHPHAGIIRMRPATGTMSQ
jgi:hypothetical protein